MARPVQAEDHIEAYFTDRIKQRADTEVGLLIGKPVVGSRALVLAVVPSPDQDGAPAVTVSTSAATCKGGGGKKGAGGAAGGGRVTLEADWVAEHARQVSRMLPGGLEVLGLYLLAPDAAWGAAAGALCGALATIATDLDTAAGGGGGSGGGRQLLLLHVDAASRKMTARSCAAAPPPSPAALKVVELRGGSAVGSLVRLEARVEVDASLPAVTAATGAKPSAASRRQRLQDLADALVGAEAARWEAAIPAIAGAVPAEGTAIGDLVPADAGPDGAAVPVSLFAAPPAVTAAAVAAEGAPSAAAPLLGVASLRGQLCGVAYVHRRDPAGRALAELRADLAKSLRARLDLAAEEALAAADDAAASGSAGGSDQAAGAVAPAHPLLGTAAARRAVRLALPRRVLLPWRAAGAALRVCDYLGEGEGPAAAAERAGELLGFADNGVSVADVEEVEAPPGAAPGRAAAPSKARGSAVAAAAASGGDGGACSNPVVAAAAAGAAAALAVAVGYLSMGSS